MFSPQQQPASTPSLHKTCLQRVPLTGILFLATLTLEARLKTYIYCTYSGRTDSGRTARFENLSPHPGPDHTELTAQMLRTFRSDSVCLGETLSDPTEHTAQMLKNETIQDQVPISSPPPPLYLSAITCQYTCFLHAASGPVVKYCLWLYRGRLVGSTRHQSGTCVRVRAHAAVRGR